MISVATESKHPGIGQRLRHHWAFLVLLVLCGALLFYKPTEVRPFWFDEGWTLSIARNWVEFGHYGERNGGEFVPSTILNTGFPATSLYAMTFQLFGVGTMQARIAGNVIVLVCLILYYLLVNLLFDRHTAILTLLIALFSGVHPFLIPLLSGRQALGEMPMFLYVLAGFVSFIALRKRHVLWVAVPGTLFALAIHTKPQILPFLMVGLVMGFVIALIKGERDEKRQYGWLLISLVISVFLLGKGWGWYSTRVNRASAASTDPYAMVRNLETLLLYVVVLRWDVRLLVINQLMAWVGLTGLVGVIGVLPTDLRKFPRLFKATLMDHDTVTLVLWCMCFAWYSWWILISNAWPRYVFPAFFLSAMFMARLIVRTYASANHLYRTNGTSLLRQRLILIAQVVCILIVLGFSGFRTYVNMTYWYQHPSSAFEDTVAFINETVEDDALIETYESELFFLLNADYHYPPNDVQHSGVQREYLGEDVHFTYDVEAIAPDYIVTGTANGWWHMYDDIVASDRYLLVYDNAPYQVYRRISVP